MKKTIFSLIGIFLIAVFALPVIMAEAEYQAEPVDREITHQTDQTVDLINLSVADDLSDEGIVRLKIQHKNIVESYLIDTKKELPKTLTYSALKPGNSYGITLEAMEIRPPEKDQFYHVNQREIPAENRFHYLLQKQIE